MNKSGLHSDKLRQCKFYQEAHVQMQVLEKAMVIVNCLLPNQTFFSPLRLR